MMVYEHFIAHDYRNKKTIQTNRTKPIAQDILSDT